jgi:Protein of unknown function (DUF998)
MATDVTPGSPAEPGPRDDRSAAWRTAGRWCAVGGWVLWIALQVVAKDPFPPEISLSQYGLGSTGWLFTLWIIVLASGPLLLMRYRPVPGPARWLLAVGFFGSVVTAVVRTDEDGLQMSVHAKVHMTGSILASLFMPLGMLLAIRFAAQPWRRMAGGLAVTAAAAGGMVLLSAAGTGTAGLGPAASWALWEGSLCIVEMLLVSLYALAVSTIGPSPPRADPAAPVQSAIQ